MASLAATIIFGFVSTYLVILGIVYGFYAKAREKIEETCKVFRGLNNKEIPSEEQAKIVEEELPGWKKRAEEVNSVKDKKRAYYFEVNLHRYKMSVRILNLMTLGKFKHFV